MWFNVKRNCISNFSGDDMEDILKELYNVPHETKFKEEFMIRRKDIDIYRVLDNCIKSGQYLIILRNNEVLMDGRQFLKDLVDFYESNSNLSIMMTQCYMDLSSIRIIRDTQGEPIRLF